VSSSLIAAESPTPAPPREEPAPSRGRELADRADARMLFSMIAANAMGGLLVLVFVGLVLPSPLGIRGYADDVQWRNLVVIVVYSAVSFPLGTYWSRRRFLPIRTWLIAERDPTERERSLAVHAPLRQLTVNAVLWTVGAAVFVAVNAPTSYRLAVTVGSSVLFGGTVTCALAYLIAERLLRPVLARALADAPPERALMPGIGVRMLLAWTLGAAVPLVGIGTLASQVLIDTPISGKHLAGVVLFQAAVGVAVGLFAVVATAKSVSEPLRTVREALRRVRGGDSSVEIPVTDASEVGLLQAGFNDMVLGLRERERLHDLFGRHVGEDVARRALERGVELGGESREVAVVFVDIVGSTALAGQRSPGEVVGLLNRFFTIVIEVMTDHSGWVNKFEGDAALCVFGAPADHSDPRGSALAAGRSLQARLRAEMPELPAAVGISAGQAVAGNVGARERFEYTVIGDPINEAARLTERAKATSGRILASGRSLEGAREDECARWRLGEAVVLRGRSEPTTLASPTA
jgi:adenylate cyclase